LGNPVESYALRRLHSLRPSTLRPIEKFLPTLMLGLALAGAAGAQAPQTAPTRLPEGTEIRVDGLFNEAVWKDAAILGSLTQVEPVQGAAPSRPTEVRLAYDADFIYLGITCFDEPEEVRARQRDRDANVEFDDVIQFWFDTFHDKRFAYWFQVSAGGSRGDALLADGGTSFNKDWDGIWYGRTQLTDQG
jgi:hypothetical protein